MVLAGVAGLRRSFGGWSQSGGESDRSRRWNGAAGAFRPYEGLSHVVRNSESTGNDVVRTEIGESSWTSHHGHGVSSRRWAEELSALVEIIKGTINFYRDVSRDLEKLSVPMNAWDLISRPLKYHANTLVEGD